MAWSCQVSTSASSQEQDSHRIASHRNINQQHPPPSTVHRPPSTVHRPLSSVLPTNIQILIQTTSPSKQSTIHNNTNNNTGTQYGMAPPIPNQEETFLALAGGDGDDTTNNKSSSSSSSSSYTNNTNTNTMRKELSFGTLMHVYDDENTDTGTVDTISRDAVQRVLKTVSTHFPKALTAHTLAYQLRDVLAHQGFLSHTTTLGFALCGDNVNRALEDEVRLAFENGNGTSSRSSSSGVTASSSPPPVALHGLAGFLFGGSTAVADMLQHIPGRHCGGNGTTTPATTPATTTSNSNSNSTPCCGNGLLIYGPHVGVDWDGVVGKVHRPNGGGHASACCAAAAAAATAANQVLEGTRRSPFVDNVDTNTQDPTEAMLGAQRIWVQRQVLPHAERLRDAAVPAVELPRVLLECQTEMMTRYILPPAIQSSLKEGCQLAVVGGIQINTPEGTPEYFLPLVFDLYGSKDGPPEPTATTTRVDMLEQLHNTRTNTAAW